VSALAFTILAVLLVGPAPALLARATWPLRAPRAAMVLWQAIALAAVLSAFSAGIAIATRLFMPGPDGRPTASIIGAAGRLDFTVIGPAVNLTARIESLCRQLGRELLLSSDFVSAGGISANPLGRFSLKGVAADQEIFAPVSPD